MSSSTYERPELDAADTVVPGWESWEDRDTDDAPAYVLPPSQWSTHDVNKALVQALALVAVVSAVLLLLVAAVRPTL